MPGAAARRYARALFRLAEEESRSREVLRELDALAEVFEAHPAAREALFRPLHPQRERQRVLEALADRLGSSPTVRQFCAVLVEHRRLSDFAEIHAEFARLVDVAAGRVQAEVRSAHPLGDAQRDRLRRALAAHTGKEVDLEVTVDPSLIGGVVARVGDLVIDGSLRLQLEQLRTTLTKGR